MVSHRSVLQGHSYHRLTLRKDLLSQLGHLRSQAVEQVLQRQGVLLGARGPKSLSRSPPSSNRGRTSQFQGLRVRPRLPGAYQAQESWHQARHRLRARRNRHLKLAPGQLPLKKTQCTRAVKKVKKLKKLKKLKTMTQRTRGGEGRGSERKGEGRSRKRCRKRVRKEPSRRLETASQPSLSGQRTRLSARRRLSLTTPQLPGITRI